MSRYGGLLADVADAVRGPEHRWLNRSVLVFTALLPFNAFGLEPFGIDVVEGPYFSIKFTKLALLVVAASAAVAIVRGEIAVRRAWFLYGLLALQALANFLSVIYSPNQYESLMLAITAAQYSVFVFIIVNVVRSEKLLRAVLVVMAASACVLVAHSIGVYISRGGDFHTRYQSSIVGNEIGGYLAYALLMFGTGLVYLVFRLNRASSMMAAWLLVGSWMFALQLVAVKMAQLAELAFLALLTAIVPRRRLVAAGLFATFVLVLLIHSRMVPITNAYLAVRYNVEAGNFSGIDFVDAATLLARSIIVPEAFLAATAEDAWSRSSGGRRARAVPRPVLRDMYSPQNRTFRRWSEVNSSAEIRFRGLMVGFLMGMRHPLTGIGVGQTGKYFEDMSNWVADSASNPKFYPDLPGRDYFVTGTHFPRGDPGIFNIFMNAWAETGGFGLFAIVGIIGLLALKAVRALWTAGREMTSLHFLFPLFLALIFFHQTIYMWFHPWLWTVVALTYGSAEIIEERRVSPRPSATTELAYS